MGFWIWAEQPAPSCRLCEKPCPQDNAYRCLACNGWYHATCLSIHFGGTLGAEGNDQQRISHLEQTIGFEAGYKTAAESRDQRISHLEQTIGFEAGYETAAESRDQRIRELEEAIDVLLDAEAKLTPFGEGAWLVAVRQLTEARGAIDRERTSPSDGAAASDPETAAERYAGRANTINRADFAHHAAALLEGAEADPDVADTAWAIIAHHREHRTKGVV